MLSKGAILEEGKAFVRKNPPGYDALIAVHMDTDNVSINSVWAVEGDERPWMMRDESGTVLRCEVSEGGKHQDNPNFRHHCQDWLLEYSRNHGLTMEDNNRIEAERKKQRYAEKYNELKQKVLGAVIHSDTIPEFRETLKRDYNIDLIHRGNTYRLHTPESNRNILFTTIGISHELLYALV